MAVYLCHEQPDLYEHDAVVLAVRPGAIALSRSAFHPGGGGQVADRGTVSWSGRTVEVTGVEVDGDTWWHLLSDALSDPAAAPDGEVASLHTTSHVLNALVFAEFAGALVTGAQINGDGSGRMDFDLPDVDNERLRRLEDPVNDVIRRGLDVRSVYVDVSEAERAGGLVRSMSVAPPPTPDGRLRLIDIDGLDRQACGGTHLSNTGESPLVRITKIENKGRHNRRIRFAFA
jgi:misacylated tRNA(Ala) deacylase